MPEFVLDTSGGVGPKPPGMWGVERGLTWADLDAFTQGYVEALFFTENAPGVTTEEWQATEEHEEGSIPGDVGFSDLAPTTLARIIRDCADFQGDTQRPMSAPIPAYRAVLLASMEPDAPEFPDEAQAGRDFWYTRNGHGCGFWDGDWPEPYASQLTEAAKAFREVNAYLGDDGKVYLS